MARTDTELLKTLEAIQRSLESLTARVARLESQLVDVYAHEDEEQSLEPAPGRDGSPSRPSLPAEGRKADVESGIDPDVILAISAAVAAYLGERAHVKQIRLISSQAWGQQGRVSVQASHALYR
jgi:methylmalonyl-CoA carboxyltransferase large subunit